VQFRHRQNSSIQERSIENERQHTQRHAENKTEVLMPKKVQQYMRQSQPHIPDRLHTGLIEPEESKSVLVPH
jgi:hypothetical protein